MQATERAIVRLTEAHTEMTEAGAVEWPPLLVWLEESITRASGRRGSSAGAGLPLNTDALQLATNLRQRARLMGQALCLPLTGGMVADTIALWGKAQDERSGGRIDDEQWEHITYEFPSWVTRIEELDDRPRSMELTVACPRCELRWVEDDGGERHAAVSIEFRDSEAPTAECRNTDCGAIWVGWADVARLGYTVGAAQDAAVLAAAGISVSIE